LSVKRECIPGSFAEPLDDLLPLFAVPIEGPAFSTSPLEALAAETPRKLPILDRTVNERLSGRGFQ
jgi:hypothetical protein